MPTYEYKCKNCKYLFDELQTMSEAPLTECPSCHTQSLERLIGTGTAMIFKGSGFYLTDYKSGSSPASSGSSSSLSPKSDSSSSSSSKSESSSSSSKSESSTSSGTKSGDSTPKKDS